MTDRTEFVANAQVFVRGMVATLFILLVSPAIHSEPVLRSSVSPEFTDGLHVKYLQYLAAKLDVKLDVYPMPFARRIDALEQGKIDIMVGLKRSYAQAGFEYLEPPYEALSNTYYVRAAETDTLNSASDLSSLILGITIDNPNSQLDTHGKYRAVVRVTSLEQKIQLLHLGRIDAFAHFQGSSQLKIEQLNLEDAIVEAPYQPGKVRNYYVALSTASPFYSDKDKLTEIIRRGVENGDFAAIRLAHEISVANHP